MSNDRAISLRGVGKMYKVFNSRLDNFIDAMGFARLMPWRPVKFREFWALRGLDVEIARATRLGIIGCNGAGKTTLLKLITGNLPVTEGSLTVNGRVHALMTTGAGFHPEFTGRENIEASLVYQGLSAREIEAATDEIAEFTELDTFLDQPFKTYSAGMQARLTFATATTLTPDILIVDEILGAGDGYFIAKSTERITRLVQETGATVLLVSHALDQTIRFCEETLWLDRGRIVQRGPTLEVVKAYEQFLRVRTEQRLKAKNKLRGERDSEAARLGMYNNNLLLRFVVNGKRGATCDIADITLRENGEEHDHIGVGGAQDSDTSRPAFVQFEQHNGWSSPQSDRDRHYRSVVLDGPGATKAAGSVIFYLYGFFDEAVYTADVTHRCRDAEEVEVEIWKDGRMIASHWLPAEDGEWTTQAIEVAALGGGVMAKNGGEDAAALSQGETKRAARRWPSKGTLLIRDVTVCGPNRQEQVVFAPGQSMTIMLRVEAEQAGEFRVRPVVNFHRLDGVLVSKHHPESAFTVQVEPSDPVTFSLDLPQLNFGAGSYVFSAALFGDELCESDRYDLIDRAFEFEVVCPELKRQGAVFHHPSQWRIA